MLQLNFIQQLFRCQQLFFGQGYPLAHFLTKKEILALACQNKKQGALIFPS